MTGKAEAERQAQYERDNEAATLRKAIATYLGKQEQVVSQGLVSLRKSRPKYDSLVSDLAGKRLRCCLQGRRQQGWLLRRRLRRMRLLELRRRLLSRRHHPLCLVACVQGSLPG